MSPVLRNGLFIVLCKGTNEIDLHWFVQRCSAQKTLNWERFTNIRIVYRIILIQKRVLYKEKFCELLPVNLNSPHHEFVENLMRTTIVILVGEKMQPVLVYDLF